ncbi:DUF6113 family protein [Mumia sp. DW29H23]|uniref:DUF6113 family protein n=1 Tax=Mumia sp. DW29H23 TaxID=3421241 RepID=UPI003D69CD8B
MTSSRARDNGRARARDNDRARARDNGRARERDNGTARERDNGLASLGRPLALVLAAVLGVVLCIGGLVVHRHVDLHVPWGLILALAALLVTLRAAGLVAGVAGAVVLALAYGVVLLLTMSSRPEGDYLVAADALGYAFLLGSLVVLGLGVVLAVRGAGHIERGTVDRPRTLGS